MAVTVTKQNGEMVINFPVSEEDFVVLPEGSMRTVVDGAIRYGTSDTYLEVKGAKGARRFLFKDASGENMVMQKTSVGRDTTSAQRDMAFDQLETAWADAQVQAQTGVAAAAAGGSRKLRLQKQTRRAKRNTRNNKRRKLRKLTTRRR